MQLAWKYKLNDICFVSISAVITLKVSCYGESTVNRSWVHRVGRLPPWRKNTISKADSID